MPPCGSRSLRSRLDLALFHEHLERFGTNEDGLLFWGVRGGQLSESTYCRVWRNARAAALTTEQVHSPLAARPYDLRPAAASTWLNAGVAPTQVAEWAGHSVAVLLQIYAKCIDGQEELARTRIAAALDPQPVPSTHRRPRAAVVVDPRDARSLALCPSDAQVGLVGAAADLFMQVRALR